MAKEEKKVKAVTMIYSLGIFLVVFLLFVGVAIYKFGMSNRLIQKVVQIIPFPAATINTKEFISMNELNSQLGSVRMFYENQDFS